MTIVVSVGVGASSNESGLRPVNLRTDLAGLADLIELAFADTMDNSGRAAIREMRMISHLGVGLNMLMGMNEVAQGVGLGYVWVDQGRLVGNVSVYPAQLANGRPGTWIIANVAVHPQYRGRGIAKALMDASMTMIQQRGRRAGPPRVILQVDADNIIAQRLYHSGGFAADGTWTTWRRPSSQRTPPLLTTANTEGVYITRRTGREWRAEYALAQRVRSVEVGGVGWLRPLEPSVFHRGWLRMIGDAVSGRSIERLIVRGAADEILAALWVESTLGTSAQALTLLVDAITHGQYADALLHTIARRAAGRTALTLEHPADDLPMNDLLMRYGFVPQRTLLHMRWGW